VDVDDRVGFRQQQRGFGRRLGAEIERKSQRGEDDDGDRQRNEGALAQVGLRDRSGDC
jgi:hypothetical protein